MSSLSIRQARDHITAIRKDKGLDGSNKRAGIVADFERALRILSDQLYQESTHFLLEMIQNSDDNKYLDGIEPTLEFTLKATTLQIDCNEAGFTPENVESICSVNLSTKAGQGKATEYVGEKGIGFKSVFKMASVVWINSGPYSFKFDRDEPLGMIAPIWEDFPGTKRPGLTSFFLKLQPDCNPTTLANDLRKLEHRSMIFLRRLRRITVRLLQTSPPQTLDIRVEKEVSAQSGITIATLHRDRESERFLVFNHEATDLGTGLPSSDKRATSKASKISIAFPLTLENAPKIEPQSIYAFLPIRDYGFKFLLNADFLLTANRQDIMTGHPWNRKLAVSCGQAIVDTFHRLALEPPYPGLQYTWMRYLPTTIPKGTMFSGFDISLRHQLRSAPLLLTEAGTLAPATSLLYVPSEFRDKGGKPLTLSSETAAIYLSSNYDDIDITSLGRLGVRPMSVAEFLVDLEDALQSAPSTKTYCAALARVLIKHLGDEGHGRLIRALPIIRIRGGKWVRANAGSIYFPGDQEDLEIPEGVNAMVVASQFAKAPDIKVLYSALGVTQLSALGVCQLIISTHDSSGFEASSLAIHDLISHVMFLFKYNFEKKGMASRMVVLTDQGSYVRAAHVYQITQNEHSAKRYLEKNGNCHFLDHRYFEASGTQIEAFSQWLVAQLDIWVIPRLVHTKRDGSFSITPEFKWLITPELRALMGGYDGSGPSSSEVLVLLRDHWELTYSSWFPVYDFWDDNSTPEATSCRELKQELSWFYVDCSDNSGLPLCQTFFPFPEWHDWHALVPLLDIPAPEDPRWKFLEVFGISVKKSAHFYLRCLEALSSKDDQGPESMERIKSVYDGIQDWLQDGEELVKKIFKSKPLVYVPPEEVDKPGLWLDLQNCTWDGPKLRHFVSIAKHYPSHRRLFCDILEIKDLELDHVIYEIENLKTDARIDYITFIWRFLKQWLEKPDRDRTALAQLRSKRAFPVLQPRQTMESSLGYDYLAPGRPQSEWFIPDREDLFEAFAGKLPYLAFDLDTSQELKIVFLALGLENRFLSNAAKEDPLIEGAIQDNHNYTSLLVSTKVEYLTRLIPETHGDRKTIAQSLRELSVHTAGALKQRWHITYQGKPVHGHPEPISAVLAPEGGKLKIYLLKKHIDKKTHYQFHFELANLLASYCHVEEKFKMLVLLVISEKNDEIIKLAFAKMGVRRLAPDEDVFKKSYFQDFDAPTTSKPPAISRIEQLAEGFEHTYKKVKILKGRPKRPSSIPSSIPSPASTASSNRFSPLEDFLESGGADDPSVYYINSDSEEDLSSSDESDNSNSEEYQDAKLVLLTKGGKWMRRQRRKKRRQQAKPELDDDVAVAGEFWLSKYFTASLPKFYKPVEHWTSKRREKVGIKPVDSTDLDSCTSSFTIPDFHGDFTRFLVSVGYDVCKSWLASPPRYHIEAVGTEKGLGSPFLLRNDWWKMAQEFTLPEKQDGGSKGRGAEIPQEVCILARIYSMGSEKQNASFILDPWKWFVQHKMSMEAEDMYVGRVRGTTRR